MANDKITIDRNLFERLTHAAIELESEWHWKAGIPGARYGEALRGVQSLVREAVAIRDARRSNRELDEDSLAADRR